MRAALGVCEDDDPDTLNATMLSHELVRRGYPIQHTLQALEKSEFDVDAAASWLDSAKEWLYDDENKLDGVPIDQIKVPALPATPAQQLDKLVATWAEFVK